MQFLSNKTNASQRDETTPTRANIEIESGSQNSSSSKQLQNLRMRQLNNSSTIFSKRAKSSNGQARSGVKGLGIDIKEFLRHYCQ